jgi:endo-1,3-1,4-beta-glycanase ExoK
LICPPADYFRMRRALLLCLFALLAFPTSAAAAQKGFLDGFATLDATRWAVGQHELGRSTLSPANVSIGGGSLALALPRTDGGEIRSLGTFASGVARARLRAADAPSSITGFFLYAPPDLASEIDVEIYNDPFGTVMFTTYAGGRQTHTVTSALGFDPTAAFHDYEIRWASGSVTFSVDGLAVRSWSTGVPKAPMNLYANAWFPSWLDGLAPLTPRATAIDEIEYRAR